MEGVSEIRKEKLLIQLRLETLHECMMQDFKCHTLE